MVLPFLKNLYSLANEFDQVFATYADFKCVMKQELCVNIHLGKNADS